MMLLGAVLVALGAIIGLLRLPREGGSPGPAHGALVAILLLLPLAYSAKVLNGSWSRLDAFHLTYAGKQLAYGPEQPFTAGGSATESEHYEDLHQSRLTPRSLRIEPADEETAARLEGVETGAPILHLQAPSPVVRIDGTALNSYPLEDGDLIVLEPGQDAVELLFQGGALRRGEQSVGLPGALSGLLKGPSQIFYLPDLLAVLDPDGTAQRSYYSLFHRPSARGPWHLLIREPNIQVERAGAVVGAFADATPIPRELDLQLQIAWGSRDRRVLRTARRDQLSIGEDRVEVRFGRPQKRVVALGGIDEPRELGLVVPSTVDRRDHLLELDEHSARFRGLAAGFDFEPGGKNASLRYLGDRLPVELGKLYALGEGLDQMLLRVERSEFPFHLLLDLALWALFAAVFMGRGMVRDTPLAAVVATTGLLLANRLLFSYRAATSPPGFYSEGYGEARLALWLVPAAILMGWSLAWWLKQPRPEKADTTSTAPLRWPLIGLLIAGCGVVASTRGVGNLVWLAALPWMGAGALVLLQMLSSGPRLRPIVRRWQSAGWTWKVSWLVLTGALILAVRWTASLVGMQETLRIPAIQFRMLWTVLQLPLCAIVVALTLHWIEERHQKMASEGASTTIRDGLLGVCALGIFAGLAFLAVALLVGDTGLVIVHALPLIFALLLVLAWPPALKRASSGQRLAHGIGLGLAALPLVLVLTANVAPGFVVRLVGWGDAATEGAESPGQVVDRAAQLSSTKAQQLFRLYMLANPGVLSEVGLQPSERVAIHYHTLQSYAESAGWSGEGFASTPLPRHLGITYLSDLVPMVFVLGDFGTLGVFSLALLYLLVWIPVGLRLARRAGADRLDSQGLWIATLALLAFVLPSLYMILANLNLVLFTGKNCNLLSLNSVSDVLESAALLGLAVFGLGLRRRVP